MPPRKPLLDRALLEELADDDSMHADLRGANAQDEVEDPDPSN
jgi:hypothetical protein